MNSWISLTIFALFCASSLAQTDPCNSSCASNQVCVNLGAGYQCSYQSCSDLQCDTDQICINDGGVARCIDVASPASTPAPDPCNSACGSNQVCVNLGAGYQCQYQSCSDIQCESDQVCINDGGVARCITTSNSSPNAASASTTAPVDQCNNTCSSDTICVNLGQGYQCQPRECSQLQCGTNQVCINDGGVARCITVSQPNPCLVAVSVNARLGGSFVNNGVPQQVYDLVFTNTGSQSVSSLSVTITPSGDATIPAGQMWNMEATTTTNTYIVDFYNTLPATNSQYFGAGFILSGSNSQTAPTAVATPTC